MSDDNANILTEETIKQMEVNQDTRFFTNGDYYEEKTNREPGNHCHAITSATFDTGVIVLNARNIGLVWAQDED